MAEAADTGSPTPGSPLIRRAKTDEALVVADLVRASFATVAQELGIDIPPLFESADDVAAAMEAGEAVLIAEWHGDPVGTVRGETLGDGSVMVRRLAVLPGLRRQGIARQLMAELENAYPSASRFELFTGAEAAAPIAL